MSEDEIDKTDGEKPKRRVFGCGLVVLLLGLAALGGGVHLMGRWDALNGSGKAGAIILIILGTLLLLPFIIVVALRVIIGLVVGKVTKELSKAGEELKKAGGAFVAQNKALYGSIHEFRAAEDDDFEELDRSLYDQAQEALGQLGYRHLGDIVDQTIEETSGMSPVIRVMSSTDGSTGAGVYHFIPPAMPRSFEGKQLLIGDFTTEFTDNTFLMTSNTRGLDQTTAATGIDRRQHPLETPLAELAQLHETEQQKLLAAKNAAGGAEVKPMIISTLADAIESEKRQQALKNAFRKQIGSVDPEEVRRVASNMDPEIPGLGDIAAGAADEARKREQADDQN